MTIIVLLILQPWYHSHDIIIMLHPECWSRGRADSAVRDRIGKGHNPDIAPLSGIVAKLKAQQEALAAKCAPLQASGI